MATPREPTIQPAIRKAYGRPSTPVPTMETMMLPRVWADVAVPLGRLPLPSLPSKSKRGASSFNSPFALAFSLLGSSSMATNRDEVRWGACVAIHLSISVRFQDWTLTNEKAGSFMANQQYALRVPDKWGQEIWEPQMQCWLVHWGASLSILVRFQVWLTEKSGIPNGIQKRSYLICHRGVRIFCGGSTNVHSCVWQMGPRRVYFGLWTMWDLGISVVVVPDQWPPVRVTEDKYGCRWMGWGLVWSY